LTKQVGSQISSENSQISSKKVKKAKLPSQISSKKWSNFKQKQSHFKQE